MKILQVNTTQNVAINFKLANVGQRLLAFILDNVIKLAYLYLIVKFFDFRLLNEAFEDDPWSSRAIDVLLFLPITTYTLVQEILMNGQTLGKKVMNLRVINIEGFKPSIIDYIMRWFMRIVDFNLFILIVIYAYSFGFSKYEVLLILLFLLGKMIGFLSIIFTKNNQRFGDIAANTIVIALKDDTQFSHTILQELSDVYKPTYPNVIKLSDNDVRIIKGMYENARKNKQYKTLIKLRQKIEDVTGITSKHKTDIEFIDIVLKDYNFYTKDM